MPYPFNVEEEMLSYVTKLRSISAYCRLSHEEEAFIMSQVPEDSPARTLHFRNRENIIKASFVLDFEGTSTAGRFPARSFSPIYPPQQELNIIHFYNEPIDLDILDTSKPNFRSVLAKLVIERYKRPEKSLSGAEAVKYLIEMFDNSRSPGFFLLYELFTNAYQIAVLSDDNSFHTASVLLRCLPFSIGHGIQGALLRAIEAYPSLVDKLPVFEDKRYLKLPTFAGLDIYQTHVNNVAQVRLPLLHILYS
jgi:hypothetical protein